MDQQRHRIEHRPRFPQWGRSGCERDKLAMRGVVDSDDAHGSQPRPAGARSLLIPIGRIRYGEAPECVDKVFHATAPDLRLFGAAGGNSFRQQESGPCVHEGTGARIHLATRGCLLRRRIRNIFGYTGKAPRCLVSSRVSTGVSQWTLTPLSFYAVRGVSTLFPSVSSVPVFPCPGWYVRISPGTHCKTWHNTANVERSTRCVCSFQSMFAVFLFNPVRRASSWADSMPWRFARARMCHTTTEASPPFVTSYETSIAPRQSSVNFLGRY